jgi:hypothetical protein
LNTSSTFYDFQGFLDDVCSLLRRHGRQTRRSLTAGALPPRRVTGFKRKSSPQAPYLSLQRVPQEGKGGYFTHWWSGFPQLDHFCNNRGYASLSRASPCLARTQIATGWSEMFRVGFPSTLPLESPCLSNGALQ